MGTEPAHGPNEAGRVAICTVMLLVRAGKGSPTRRGRAAADQSNAAVRCRVGMRHTMLGPSVQIVDAAAGLAVQVLRCHAADAPASMKPAFWSRATSAAVDTGPRWRLAGE